MKKSVKRWLFLGSCLAGIGLLLFAAAMTTLHWDFSKLNTADYITNTHEIREEFQKIEIDTDTADLCFALSDDGLCRIVCYEQTGFEHSAEVRNGTLFIKGPSAEKWYDRIGINLKSPSVTVYLPASEYAFLTVKESTGEITVPEGFSFGGADLSLSTGDVDFSASSEGQVKIHTSTGDIRIRHIRADSLDLSTSTGKITVSGAECAGDLSLRVTTGETEITDTVCRGLTSTGSTGDLSLANVTAREKLSIERSTGDVTLCDSDAAEIFIKTTTGNVSGNLLSDKVFLTETSTGTIDVPKTVTGGKCEIITSTGDIRFG